MVKELTLRLLPEVANQPDELRRAVSRKGGIPLSELSHVDILNRSVDARQRTVFVQLRVNAYVKEEFVERPIVPPDAPNVANAEELIVIGMGPAGLFAALQLIKNGKKPVILERGKDVKDRIVDLKGINVKHEVNPDSNYCFGEGGAGTYSDGKLYTRSKKRGNVREILETLVAFGAVREILADAHPHIGTNKLPAIIANMRNYILSHGGEVRFNTRVTDFVLDGDRIVGVETTAGRVMAKHVILATGHSARDIFELLHRRGIEIELKPLSIGVRVEHTQSLIDSIQYHCEVRSPYLPPSPYSIVRQVHGRGVYSFCMCPGGVIAPCATSPGEIVTNGWSSSSRARSTANSGIVVELRTEDFKEFAQYGPLEEILAHAQEITKKRPREALLAQEAEARLSKQLVTIHCDVPVTLDAEQLRVNAPDADALRALYLELEFTSLLKDVGGAASVAAPAARDATTGAVVVTLREVGPDLVILGEHA
jgi:uncharacterized FAD-dependent dehydrogenase